MHFMKLVSFISAYLTLLTSVSYLAIRGRVVLGASVFGPSVSLYYVRISVSLTNS